MAYAYTVSAGTLPTGLTLNSSTGVLAGTPSLPGSYSFTVTASDPVSGVVVSRPYTVNIATAPLLNATADFTPLGYVLSDGGDFNNGGQIVYGRGLTHRYVNGQLRFLTMAYGGAIGDNPVFEFALPNTTWAGTGSSSGTLTTGSNYTNYWPEIYSPALGGPNIGGGDLFGIEWDDAKGGLWLSNCTVGFTSGGSPGSDSGAYITHAITFRQLVNGNPGSISGFTGPYGFSGVGCKRVACGVRAVPAAWQTTWGFAPYFFGFGSSASTVGTGYVPSLGLFLLSNADVTTFGSSDAAITGFQTHADHSQAGSVSSTDWKSAGSPDAAGYDRGYRNSNVKNYFDDPHYTAITNPSTFPTGSIASATGNGSTVTVTTTAAHNLNTGCPVTITGNATANVTDGVITVIDATDFSFPSTAVGITSGGTWVYGDPSAQAGWLDPMPDGHGRWTLYDTFDGTAFCVGGGSRYGFGVIGTFANGKAYYSSSTVVADGLDIELQIYDPADFAAVQAGTKRPFDVQPKSTRVLTNDFPALAPFFVGTNSLWVCCVGATYDPTTKILYFMLTRRGGVSGLNGVKTIALCAYEVNA